MEEYKLEYCLNIDFNIYDIGRDYHRKNQKCIFDPIREIFIAKTPEEIVRQKVVKHLIEALDVPKSKIDIEVPMTHFKKGAKGRADIVVYGENKSGFEVPIILIECKSPNVPLIDDVWFQAYKYDDILGSGFIIITNANYTYAAVWDEDDEEYYFIEELPKYQQLLSGGGFKFICDNSEEWKRPNFSELTSPDTINEFLEYGWIGESTDICLYPLIVNLAGFLQDTSVKFSSINIDGLDIIEDGHRYTSFGNASGGSWEGDYRYFILEDKESNNQIISMSIFGHIKGYTTLVVAIDDFEKKHNSLQLNIDKYTIVEGNKYTIWHDGTMTIGRNGATKRKEVIDYIKNCNLSMIDSEGRVVLGSFDCNKEICWNQQNTKDFIGNLIKYAILRDEFRRIKQE